MSEFGRTVRGPVAAGARDEAATAQDVSLLGGAGRQELGRRRGTTERNHYSGSSGV